ncbi:unnamed protein product [Linum tenue]|uniref:FAD-binding PCMH-type domain-containing protein n=1 Tax=Linum tenue TaxID=586396 RepID=A0AAV0RS76_9ROSI|nr:unnamed protein product [Linum tenue]
MLPTLPLLLFLLLLLPVPLSPASPPAVQTCQDFIHCLISGGGGFPSNLIYAPSNPNYSTILESTIRDARFNSTSTPKPSLILTPISTSQIQAAVLCSRRHDFHIRIRSGGHDYEGLSYSYSSQFAVLDLASFRNVTVNRAEKTAWVQSGAVLGELYYRIAKRSPHLAFPAGVTNTVGVGGHFSGGGFGFLVRKFGLAADNVIDCRGRILDRASMGQDFFWAIRGGGGNTFGIAVAWKIRLVTVPSTVTVFSVVRTIEQNGLDIANKWQSVSSKLPKELSLDLLLTTTNRTKNRATIKIAIFSALFLGKTDKLLNLMQSKFPELGLTGEDCKEMTWLESVVFHGGFPSNATVEALLDRSKNSPLVWTLKYKCKSDFVRGDPIPESALLKMWEKLMEIEPEFGGILMFPWGGEMEEISEFRIPFPHRGGNLYMIQHMAYWSDEGERHVGWLRELYDLAGDYVSREPRSAYVNYRDLDIGMNGGEWRRYERARVWGEKYFGKNFERLVRVKTAVDPENLFRNEQSVPPLPRGIRSQRIAAGSQFDRCTL